MIGGAGCEKCGDFSFFLSFFNHRIPCSGARAFTEENRGQGHPLRAGAAVDSRLLSMAEPLGLPAVQAVRGRRYLASARAASGRPDGMSSPQPG